jgi:hypothetical protein
MSVHTGRMSNREAYNTLTQLRATARTLDRADLANRAHVLLNLPVDAEQIRALLAEVNELVAARLRNSATIRPLTSPATVVYLFGPQSPDATGEAAEVAAVELSTDSHLLRLVDVTPVSTATWTGARYTFRVRAAWDPAPTVPATASQAAPAAL